MYFYFFFVILCVPSMNYLIIYFLFFIFFIFNKWASWGMIGIAKCCWKKLLLLLYDIFSCKGGFCDVTNMLYDFVYYFNSDRGVIQAFSWRGMRLTLGNYRGITQQMNCRTSQVHASDNLKLSQLLHLHLGPVKPCLLSRHWRPFVYNA